MATATIGHYHVAERNSLFETEGGLTAETIGGVSNSPRELTDIDTNFGAGKLRKGCNRQSEFSRVPKGVPVTEISTPAGGQPWRR